MKSCSRLRLWPFDDHQLMQVLGVSEQTGLTEFLVRRSRSRSGHHPGSSHGRRSEERGRGEEPGEGRTTLSTGTGGTGNTGQRDWEHWSQGLGRLDIGIGDNW